MKARVLFVDDQPKILQGLRRMLRTMRGEWDMAFADGGAHALEHLGQSRVDVVVTDMRMPGMDGAELLAKIEKRHPHTIRMVLSGQCDEEAAFRIVGSSHQFLSKPCDTDTLVNTVKRALALRDLVADESLQSLVSGLHMVPSPPAIYQELLNELRLPAPSLRRVGDIVSRDVGLGAKMLQLANSAFFGIGRHVSTPCQAVNMLGLERVGALVLSHGIGSQIDDKEIGTDSFEQIHRHCIACAGLAEVIAREENLDQQAVENAFATGLLQDIGALVLCAHLPSLYAQAAEVSLRENVPRLEAERRTFGATHAAVGAYLAGLWGVPDAIVEGIAYHHTPSECPRPTVDALMAVHAAEALMQDHRGTDRDEVVAPDLDLDYLTRLGVSDRLPRWREIASRLEREGQMR